MKILILCTGNSCRSQMAQGFLRSYDKDLEVKSAGTNPAETVDTRAIRVMSESGIDISSERPKSVELFIHDTWDFVITVCDDAYQTCPVFLGSVKERVHLSFEDPSKKSGSDEFILEEFRKVRNQINSTFRTFYETKAKPIMKK